MIDGEPAIDAIGERATHRGGELRARRDRRRRDLLEQDGGVADQQLAARAVLERDGHTPLSPAPSRSSLRIAPRCESRLSIGAVTRSTPALIDREQRVLARHAVRRDRQHAAERLAKRDRVAPGTAVPRRGYRHEARRRAGLGPKEMPCSVQRTTAVRWSGDGRLSNITDIDSLCPFGPIAAPTSDPRGRGRSHPARARRRA